MRRSLQCTFVTLLGILVGFTINGLPAGAQTLSFDIDTTSLAGSGYALDIQFIDGSGLADGNNTFHLTNFQFGTGGSGTGSPQLTGGASGDVISGVTLTDTDFFSEFTQNFTQGNHLHFDGTFTTNVDPGGAPDEFSVAILDASGAEVPTTGPNNVLMLIDIDSGTPTVSQYALQAAAPSAVPEADGLLISAIGIGITTLSLGRLRRRANAGRRGR